MKFGGCNMYDLDFAIPNNRYILADVFIWDGYTIHWSKDECNFSQHV